MEPIDVSICKNKSHSENKENNLRPSASPRDKGNTDSNKIKILYYYDVFRINSDLSPNTVRDRLTKSEIKNHCKNYFIRRAIGAATRWGYETTMTFYDATDSFMEIFMKLNLGRYGITYLEIAMDVIYPTIEKATRVMNHAIQHLYLAYGRGQFIYHGKDNITFYPGRTIGRRNSMYCAIYPVTANSERNFLLKGNNLFHMEFRISGWNNIQKKLGISYYSELINAEDMFHILRRKYCKLVSINKPLLLTKLRQIGYNDFLSERIASKINSKSDLEEWISVEHEIVEFNNSHDKCTGKRGPKKKSRLLQEQIVDSLSIKSLLLNHK